MWKYRVSCFIKRACRDLVAAKGRVSKTRRMHIIFAIDKHRRLFSLKAGPDGRHIEWRVQIEAAGKTWAPAQADGAIQGGNKPICTLTFREIGLTWTLTPEMDTSTGTLLVRSTLANLSEKPLALGKAFLFDCAGPLGLWEAQDDSVALALAGAQYLRAVHCLADPQCPRRSKIKLQLFNRTRREAFQIGFVTFLRANPEVAYQFDKTRGLAAIQATCDFAGWELAPGASTATEQFCLAFGPDPFMQLENWAELAAARCVPAPAPWAKTPIGYCGGTWVDASNSENYEEVVLRNCRAIRRRLAGFGVDYVWISIGNIAEGQPGNWLKWDYGHFPGGPEALARNMRELGMTWGCWTGYFWISSDLAKLVEEFRDALLKDAQGNLWVARRQWNYGDPARRPAAQRPRLYALDPSHPKTLAFLKNIFATYRQWGVRYYMTDFLDAGAGNINDTPYPDHYDKRVVAGPEALRKAMAVVREAAGPDTYLLASSGPTVHCAGLVHGVRTGNDFGEGRAINPESWFYPATYVINDSLHGHGVGPALQNQASSWYTHRTLYINDSGNVLSVDKPIPLNEARIHATVHAMSGGPSMIGDDVDRMDEERLRLIKVTLPRPRAVAFPVDLFEAAYPDYPRIFLRSVKTSWGEFAVVAIYNLSRETAAMTLTMSTLRLKPAADYLVWEFWNAAYVGRVQNQMQTIIPPMSACVFRMVEDRHEPVLLGTDMHLLMGEMEVTHCGWDPGRMMFSGRAIRPAGESGSLFVHVPASLRLADPRGYWIAKDARDSTLVVRVALDFSRGQAAWAMPLASRK